MRVIAAAFVLGLLATGSAFAKDIAICGASEGYGYYPNVGLGKPGEWVRDGIKEGRFTLTRVGDRFDLLFTDATGAVISATNDGGSVVQIGRNEEAIAVIVIYPGATVETFTFFKSQDGNEAIWSTNRYGVLKPKLTTFRAPCSFLDLE